MDVLEKGGCEVSDKCEYVNALIVREIARLAARVEELEGALRRVSYIEENAEFPSGALWRAGKIARNALAGDDQ